METRNNAWRRFRREVMIARRRGRFADDNFVPRNPLIDGKFEKSRGNPGYRSSVQLCTRRGKLARAKKLGTEYPQRTWRDILSDDD